MDSQAAYLELYDAMSDDMDYLQVNSPARNFLPEAAIAGAVGGMLLSFANGFFGRLGAMIADSTVSRIKSLFRGEPREDRTAELIDGICLLSRYLDGAGEFDPAQRLEAEGWMADYLESEGFSAAAAAQRARTTLNTLLSLRETRRAD
jgi:hypothetical protein